MTVTVDLFAVLDADERTMLVAMLDFHRDALLRKTHGLDDTQVRHSPVPTGVNLMGLLYHLTRVEQWWFEAVFQGAAFDGYPPHEHQAPADRTYPQISQDYQQQCAKSRQIVTSADLDDVSTSDFMKPSLRWVLVHMIEETARHNGHADVIRELLDGQTGE